MYEFCISCGDKLRYHKTSEEKQFRCLFEMLTKNEIAFACYHNYRRIYPQ